MFKEKQTQKFAHRLIRKYDTNNPEEMVKQLKNVDFKYEPLTKNIKGYYKYVSEKCQIIRVNDNLDRWEKRFILFHELSHYFLKHREFVLFDSTYLNKSQREYDADLLAACLFKSYIGITKSNVDNLILPKRVEDLVDKFL